MPIKENAERIAKETSREIAENYFQKENDRELREEANSTKEKSRKKGKVQKNKTASDYSAANKNENNLGG